MGTSEDKVMSAYEIMKLNTMVVEMTQKANQLLVCKLIMNPALKVLTPQSVVRYGEAVADFKRELLALVDSLAAEVKNHD